MRGQCVERSVRPDRATAQNDDDDHDTRQDDRVPTQLGTPTALHIPFGLRHQCRQRELAQVLKEQLSGVKVYKVGDEAEKQVFIVGKTSDWQWAGLKTSVVET